MASENGEESGSSQQLDSLVLQEVRNPDLLLENSALSKGGHFQGKGVYFSYCFYCDKTLGLWSKIKTPLCL